MQVRSVPHSSRCMDSGVIKVAKLWENDKSGIKPEVHSAYFSKSLQRMQRKEFKNVPTIVPLENNNVQEHVLEINQTNHYKRSMLQYMIGSNSNYITESIE